VAQIEDEGQQERFACLSLATLMEKEILTK